MIRDNAMLQIRWMIRADYDNVIKIERVSFDHAWSREELVAVGQQRNVIMCVAELDHVIVGYMVYELHKHALRLVNIAVSPDHRRCGVGRQMAERLIDKLAQQRRFLIDAEVSERNLVAQRFFAQCGFRAVMILPDHYPETAGDAYLMRYRLAGYHELDLTNRISGFFNDGEQDGSPVA